MPDKTTARAASRPAIPPDSIVLKRPKVTAALAAQRAQFATERLLQAQVGLPLLGAGDGNTTWEELTCVGLDPYANMLEAVVVIKQESGYGGTLCKGGSREYVRFFIDWHDGLGFQDVGVTGFKVADISEAPPGPQHPWHELVRLPLPDAKHRRCCSTEVLPVVRAVLSWSTLPSTNPNDTPVFGNRVEATVQVEPDPRKCRVHPGYGHHDLPDVDVPIEVNPPVIDPGDPAPFIGLPVEAPPVAWHALLEEYREAKVPDLRLVYPALLPALTGEPMRRRAAFQPDLWAPGQDLGLELPALSKELAALLAKLKEQGDKASDTGFEEITCVGLDTDADTVGAVIHLKRRSGYGGPLCSSGSVEYVAFWADWDNDGHFDEYLGTAAIRVHDLHHLPAHGADYAVSLPVNLKDRLKGCDAPNMVRIRAVLSWAVPPSTTDPDALNVWGNRRTVVVRVRERAGHHGPYVLLYAVGGVAPADIDPATHLAFPSAVPPVAGTELSNNRPFGLGVSVQGRIYDAGPVGTIRYQVQVSPLGANAWTPAFTSTTAVLAHPDPSDPLFPEIAVPSSSADGWLPYREDLNSFPAILEKNAYLGTWNTFPLNGDWELRLAFTSDPMSPPAPGNIDYSATVALTLDNDDFTVNPMPAAVINPSFDLDLVIDGGDCHQYLGSHSGGEIIHGHLRAVDLHFGVATLTLQPTTHTHGVTAVPDRRSSLSLADTGPGAETWEIDTSLLDKCGYTLMLEAWDRTILNSNTGSTHYGQKAVGFSVI